jgi:hypothetical protein
MGNLYQASQQWASRPDDQRFWDIPSMLSATRHYRESAREAVAKLSSLAVKAVDGGNLAIVGPTGQPATMTHHAFGQVAAMVGAPAPYLRSMPAAFAAGALNIGMYRADKDKGANLLIHANDSLVLRSATSDEYGRIWDCDVCERLQGLTAHGWRVPPARPCREGQAGARPATEADVLTYHGRGFGGSVNVGDMIAPAGLYASDHDMFAFMVNEDRRINDGTPDGMSRGFFISNSEVGNGQALKVKCFCYRHVCGNHIVWDVGEVTELRIVHRGEAAARWDEMAVELRRFADASAAEDEARVQVAQQTVIAAGKDAVLDAIFAKLRGDGVSRRLLDAGYDAAVASREAGDGTIDPQTVWGMVQGITAHSQTLPYADQRATVDRAAGKVLAMAF